MTTIDDIAALLDDADEQISAAAALHDQAFADTNARRRFKTRIKNVLENQRSSLDYLAVAITKQYGSPTGLIYYPLAHADAGFQSEMDGKMPGVASAEPTIAATIRKYQPYQPGMEWLRHLNRLTREQKHNRLSTQLVRQGYQCRVTEKATGAYVQWHGMTFAPGQFISDVGFSIELFSGPHRPPDAPALIELSGPYARVFGVPIDPATQRPIPSSALHVQSGQIEQWCFATPHQSVMNALTGFQACVRSVVTDIAQSARL